MKLNFGLKVPIAYDDYDNLIWYHRDAKRIKSMKSWNSGAYKKTRDDKFVIEIRNKHRASEYWIVDMVRDIQTGVTKVTPIGKVSRLFATGKRNYFCYKLVH